MGRAFQRLAKQVKGRRAPLRKWTSVRGRFYNIEVMLYELNAYVIRHLSRMESPDDELTESDKDFLAAAEDFKKVLEEVVKQNGTT